MTIEDAPTLRKHMVSDQLERRGVQDPRVLNAMGDLPRHRFVQTPLNEAYADRPLPIGHGQTISQPYMVARMTELLAPAPDHRILEIGAGSGYQTAVLARLCQHVYAVERIADLAHRAQDALGRLGITNVTLNTEDGTRGWAEHAPYDGILVAAGSPSVPTPYLEQLREGGRLVIPVGKLHLQELQCITLQSGRPVIQRDVSCRFVKLIGQHGWQENPHS
jgi:protein-L-isoaspartate(D-aspartate) O-methyltransferase